MSALLLLLGLLAFFGLGTGVGSGEAPEAASMDAICEAASTGEPCAAAEPGVGYPVVLWNSCDIEWAYLDGRYWVPESGRPVSGGDSVIVTGVMHMSTEGTALFEGDNGVDVTFVPAPADYVQPSCE